MTGYGGGHSEGPRDEFTEFGARVIRERARLAIDDPEGEKEAIAPLTQERASDILNGVDEWPNPRPLAMRDLPAFPVHLLPDWVRSFVEALAEATQTPVDMAAMFCLAALATIAGGRVLVVPLPGWLEGVNLFVAVIMEPGARKSAVQRETTAPILAHERLLVEQARPDITERAAIRRIAEAVLANSERRAAGAADPEDRAAAEEDVRRAAASLENLEVPTPPRLFTSDVTPEMLASLLHENGGRMAVLSAEGGLFETMAGRYSNGIPNLDVFLAGYSGDALRVDRRGRASEFVDRPALTIGLAVQPFMLRKAGRIADFGGRGLLDRFLFAIPTGNVGYRRMTPTPMPEAVRRGYDTGLRALAASLEHANGQLTLTFTSEASTVFAAWREEIEPRRRPDADLGHIQGWASKLDGAVARVAGLLHLAESIQSAAKATDPIERTTIEAAVGIGGYLIEHALAAFDEVGADPRLDGARRLLRWLQKQARPTFSKRDAHAANRAAFSKASDLDPCLEMLVENDFIREIASEPGVGRPSRRFEVNPKALSRKARNAQNSRIGGDL
jgi:replicative DNA helicase